MALAKTINANYQETEKQMGGVMPRFINSSTSVAFALLLAGCGQGPTVESEAKLTEAIEKIEALRGQVEVLEIKVKTQEMFRLLENVAYLTPGDEGYSVVRSDMGSMTIALVDIKPYANGSKVTLKLGNPTSATINGLNAKLEWGAVDDKGMPANESAKSRSVKFNETLNAGAWTNAAVVLDGVLPTDLGFVRVSELGHSGIRLGR